MTHIDPGTRKWDAINRFLKTVPTYVKVKDIIPKNP